MDASQSKRTNFKLKSVIKINKENNTVTTSQQNIMSQDTIQAIVIHQVTGRFCEHRYLLYGER
jgi:hypothetical protein